MRGRNGIGIVHRQQDGIIKKRVRVRKERVREESIEKL